MDDFPMIDKIEIMDSRFHGNDNMDDFPMIDKIEILDSRFHGNDKI